jgi:hypothetical protein
MSIGTWRARRLPWFFLISAVAASLVGTGCSTTEPFSEDDRRTNVEVECRGRAELSARPRQPTAAIPNAVYRQCMQERGYPNP